MSCMCGNAVTHLCRLSTASLPHNDHCAVVLNQEENVVAVLQMSSKKIRFINLWEGLGSKLY